MVDLVDNKEEDEDADDEEEFAAAQKSKNSRDRVCQTYTVKVNSSKPKEKKKPPKESFGKFAVMKSFKVDKMVKKKKVTEFVNPSSENLVLSFGFLYCDDCNESVCWNNRGPHLNTKKHKNNKEVNAKNAAETTDQRKRSQTRIQEESLVGSTYATSQIENALNWVKACFGGNIAINAIEENRVRHYISMFTFFDHSNLIWI